MRIYKTRNIFDPILITTSFHFFTLYFIVENFYYSSIVILSTTFSLIWHYEYEYNNTYYILDYFFATLLTLYERFNGNDKLFIIYVNILVLVINKMVEILSFYKFLNYKIGHSLFHVLSAVKTNFIAYKIK